MDQGCQGWAGPRDGNPLGIALIRDGYGLVMPKVSGWIYTPEGFKEGTVHFGDGIVVEVTHGGDQDPLATGLVLPCFFNAHTHLGDSVVLEEPTGTLETIVAPPHGLKFRRLQEASREELVSAMRWSLQRMIMGGTASFCDFREGGVKGCEALHDALGDSSVRGVVLGRPTGLGYLREEVDHVLQVADGIGVSSVSDWDYGELQKLAARVRHKGKILALHASEARREDLDTVLDLKPDFLVHMTAAGREDWVRCAQEGVPVVVCPRSQTFFGRVPDLPGMAAAGLELMLGTDNAMLNHPSLMREMEFAYQVAKLRGGLPPSTVLEMAYRGAKLFNSTPSITIQEGNPCNLLVLDVEARGDKAYRVIKANEADVALLSLGPRVWVRQRGWLKEV